MKRFLLEEITPHYCSYCDSSFDEVLDLISHIKDNHDR